MTIMSPHAISFATAATLRSVFFCALLLAVAASAGPSSGLLEGSSTRTASSSTSSRRAHGQLGRRSLLSSTGDDVTELDEILAVGPSSQKKYLQDTMLAFSQLEGESYQVISYIETSSTQAQCLINNWQADCGQSSLTTGPTIAIIDRPYTKEEHELNPNHVVLPLAPSALVVAYNLPETRGIKDLVLDLPTMAKVISGEIASWRDVEILAQNPELEAVIPNKPITIYISDDDDKLTVMLKRPLAPYVPFFAEQDLAGELSKGGLPAWPEGNATYEPKQGTDEKMFSLLGNPYSITYTTYNRAVELSLQTVRILEGCTEIAPSVATVEAAMSADFPSNYYGMTPDNLALASVGSPSPASSTPWPFFGYYYIVIQNHTSTQDVTCHQLHVAVDWLTWYYSSDLVSQIAGIHHMPMLKDQMRAVLLNMLREMTCNGEPQESYYHDYADDVTVKILTAASEVTSSLLPWFDTLYAGVDLTADIIVEKLDGDLADLPLLRTAAKVFPSRWVIDPPAEQIWFPWILSAAMVCANVPGAGSLMLDHQALSGILSGEVVAWNDPLLVRLNPLLADVPETIRMETHPEVLPFLDEALAEHGFDSAQLRPTESLGINQMYASLSQPYSLVVYPAFYGEEALGSPVDIVSPYNNGAVSVSTDSIKACLSTVTPVFGPALDTPGCYSLTFPVYTAVKQTYVNDAIGSKVVYFWNWMMSVPVYKHWSVVPVAQMSSEVQREGILSLVHSVTFSNGTYIYTAAGAAQKTMHIWQYAVIGLSTILVFGVLLLGFLQIRHQKQLLAKIRDSQGEYDFDADSPIMKVTTFLEGLCNGTKLDRQKAGRILLELRGTNWETPDIQQQVRRVNQTNEGEEMGNFLVQLATRNALPRSSSDKEEAPRSRGSIVTKVKSFMYRPDYLELPSGHQESGGESFCVSDSEDGVVCGLRYILSKGRKPEIPSPEELAVKVSPIGESLFFNVTNLVELTGNRPLSTVVFCIVHKEGLVEALGLDRKALCKFMLAIEDRYKDVPYHNRIHAADVTQRTYAIMRLVPLKGDLRSKVLMLAAVIGAAVHDVVHPGYNNAHLVRIESPVACRHNDQAVLENESLSVALELMRADETNFCAGSKLDQKHSMWQEFKAAIISMVLATDMSLHFEILTKFKTKFQSQMLHTQEAMQEEDQSSITMILQLVLKTADLGHCFTTTDQHLFWSKCLEEEFFRQGDEEKMIGHDISPLMDRERNGVMYPANQLGFMEFIALPLVQSFATVFPQLTSLARQAEENHRYWRQAKQHGHDKLEIREYKESMWQKFLKTGEMAA